MLGVQKVMQLNPVYLYSNQIEVYTTLDNSWTNERYRKVYNRNIKIYRSLDNRLDIQVRNCDQKSKDITGTTVVFNMVSHDNRELILQKDCITVDATKGKVYVILTEQELYSIEEGFYQYSVFQETRLPIDDDNYSVTNKKLLYADSQYGAVSTIHVAGDINGTPKETIVLEYFSKENPGTVGVDEPTRYFSQIISTKEHTQTPQSLHSFQFKLNNYTGTVVIQGSIDDSSAPSIWSDIETLSFNSDSSHFQNVVGKYNWLRIKHTPDTLNTGSVDKIYYR
jgi:hypothetical protein